MLKSDFSPPNLCFPNLVVIWHCGDISNNVPSCRILVLYDVRKIKNGSQKLSMMRYLIMDVYKDAEIVNMMDLIVRYWNPPKTLDFYNSTNHIFMLPNIKTIMKKIWETIVW